MKYLETSSQGSFDAWGSGFCYKYSSTDNALNITDARKDKAFTRLNLEAPITKDPLGYVKYLDRANQIKALVFSNDKTTCLTETIDEKRLASIVKSAALTSYYAHSLHSGDLKLFSRLFIRESRLKKIKVRKFTSRSDSTSFYAARIQTQHDNAICVRGCSLAGVMAALAEKTKSDLIIKEVGHHYSDSAHELLMMASTFSSISALLNPSFTPSQHIKRNDIIPYAACATGVIDSGRT